MKEKDRIELFNIEVSDLKRNEQLGCKWDMYYGVGCKYEDNRKCEGCAFNIA